MSVDPSFKSQLNSAHTTNNCKTDFSRLVKNTKAKEKVGFLSVNVSVILVTHCDL